MEKNTTNDTVLLSLGVFQLYIKPFEKPLIHRLDSFLILNLSVVFLNLGSYSGQLLPKYTVCGLLTLLALVLVYFFSVSVLHALWVSGYDRFTIDLLFSAKQSLCQFILQIYQKNALQNKYQLLDEKFYYMDGDPMTNERRCDHGGWLEANVGQQYKQGPDRLVRQ